MHETLGVVHCCPVHIYASAGLSKKLSLSLECERFHVATTESAVALDTLDGWGNSPNLSQPNQGIQGDGGLCSKAPLAAIF